eukprot:TRINITY_DN27566_c0_g1_i1.p1 TRINITY_DN27566_c0_g1~~TRINITY_DN27566_c0_g1_i1.p1  ORF type:complete len:112 (-),score=26.30 TRINITY_DN27566_c0_g1_i1:68-403(-)
MEDIQTCVAKKGKPVMLLGHSMGNKMIFYFLCWIENLKGREWIDHHIHTFVSVAAPWIGAPKSLRGLISGEKMGLDAIFNNKDAQRFSRSMDATLFLVPENLELYFDNLSW